MDDLYQSPSTYPYLPQSTLTNYHHQPNAMYRLNNNSSTFDRPFHIPPVNESESTEPYGYSHHHHYPQHHVQPRVGYYSVSPTNAMLPTPRPKITTNVWEDEGTMCYQVDAKGICVARRQDNDMINGTKLLNVVGMSRGKRDGILKNEKGRVVVKVGAMHLKGVWIPFNRARELASKFKIMDILFPLFAEEPNMYLNLPADAAQHDSNEVLPAVSNKCNLSSPQLAFSHKNRSDEYHNASSSSPVGLPATWDRPYQLTPTSSHYDDHQPGQILHRASHSDLQSLTGSPVPRTMLQHSHATSTEENNDLYLLNNHHNENHGYDYYHRQLNRSSFSSISSHHSYLYPSFPNQAQEEDKNNNTSYLDHSGYYNKPTLSDPYTKSSPYTTNTSIQATATETTNKLPTATTEQTTKSVGSTTPSSWFSPETPTAVLFQHKEKEEVTNSKKRKSSLSIEPTTTKKQAILSPTSPAIRAARRAKVVKTEN